MKTPPAIGRLVLGAGLCSLLTGLSAAAQTVDDGQSRATLKIEKLALFKNGLGFIVSSGVLPENAETIRIGQLPIPTLGTFWVGYPKGVRLQSLVTSMEELETEYPVESIGQLLQMNAGRKVLLHTSDRDIEGTILASRAPKADRETPSPYYMSPRQTRDPNFPYSVTDHSGNVLLFRTDKGVVALSPGTILRAEFADSEPMSIVRRRQKSPSIRMRLDKPAGGEKVTVSYLARGVTWVPGYLVDLSEPKTAKFSAHAVVINEMADLKDVKLQLVTGFPNIRFSGILNPVAKSQSLSEFLQALSGSGRGQGAGDYRMMTQAVMVNAPSVFGDEESAMVPGYSTAAEGQVAEDLYFYPAKNLTLKKDETAWLPLFSAEMPYKHIYTWKIRDFVDKDDHYRAGQEPQDQKSGEEIWHSCRITNTLSMPLTTAATQFITNDELTGQDVCYYTAPKAETTIRINKALNLVAEQAETEIDRKRDVSIIRGYHYDLVKVQGELRILNRLAKQVSVEVTKQLSGEVIDKGPNSTDTKTAEGLKKVNPKHILTWSIDLKPDEERKIAYTYQVYIRD